ncbi:hypothetical protein [Paenibacillus sp. SN-8-1]|uniref:hypothetical protein n=1 Tax=Paenibacillus sp. SN-8-1 TaxID=3435409 RepID=UPI003D9A1C66
MSELSEVLLRWFLYAICGAVAFWGFANLIMWSSLLVNLRYQKSKFTAEVISQDKAYIRKSLSKAFTLLGASIVMFAICELILNYAL